MQVSTAWTSNCIPQILWGVITCPCPWILLLAHDYLNYTDGSHVVVSCYTVAPISLKKPNLVHMMTSSNGNIVLVTSHLCGEFTGHRWILRTKASHAELWFFFDVLPNKRLSKQSWGWWFDTLSRSLWRHCNDMDLWTLSKPRLLQALCNIYLAVAAYHINFFRKQNKAAQSQHIIDNNVFCYGIDIVFLLIS